MTFLSRECPGNEAHLTTPTFPHPWGSTPPLLPLAFFVTVSLHLSIEFDLCDGASGAFPQLALIQEHLRKCYTLSVHLKAKQVSSTPFLPLTSSSEISPFLFSPIDTHDPHLCHEHGPPKKPTNVLPSLFVAPAATPPGRDSRRSARRPAAPGVERRQSPGHHKPRAWQRVQCAHVPGNMLWLHRVPEGCNKGTGSVTSHQITTCHTIDLKQT